MNELLWYQYALIGLIFAWSGFVRSGLGFGGAVLSLPFLLMIHNDPLVYLPIISVHLLVFSSITVWQSHRASVKENHQGSSNSETTSSTIHWSYLKKVFGIILVPKLIGIFGLITLPSDVMSAVIFVIIAVYSLTYIFNKPFKSNNPWLDTLFLMLGGYISGTSLIGAPLIIAVFANHVARHQLRDTLFVLWFVLVVLKMIAFIIAGVDLQLIHHLWLLPCATVGHVLGLKMHDYLLNGETQQFYRVLGSVLFIISIIGLLQAFY